MDDPNWRWEQAWKAAKEHPVYPPCGLMLAALLFSFLLGFAFVFIFQGLLFGFLWLSPYFPRTHKFFHIHLKPEVDHLPLTGWNLIPLVLKMATVGVMLFIGIRMLVQSGFLGQNIIWILLRG